MMGPAEQQAWRALRVAVRQVHARQCLTTRAEYRLECTSSVELEDRLRACRAYLAIAEQGARLAWIRWRNEKRTEQDRRSRTWYRRSMNSLVKFAAILGAC